MRQKTKKSKSLKTPQPVRKKTMGVVLSTKMQKTAVVELERIKIYLPYGKRLKRRHKVYAHDDLGAKQGDKVVIEEVRPLSKLKRWKVVKIEK